MDLPFPDAPPNFLAIAVNARRMGEEDRLNRQRQNALAVGDPGALRAVGEFQAADSIEGQRRRTAREGVIRQYGQDPDKARAAAFETGDPELVSAISQLDENQRSLASEKAKRLAAIGYSLRQRPYEERKAALAQIAPSLQGLYRFSPDQLQAFDPTDAALDGIVGSAVDVAKQIELASKTKDDDLRNELLQAQIEATKALVPQRQASADASRARAARTRKMPVGRASASSGPALPAGFVLE